MPHYPKPYFCKARKVWMVQINGQQHNLGSGRESAFDRYQI
ncbi:MAG TPA: hypothetical protein VIK18_08590 [Pirellulales bacterium]